MLSAARLVSFTLVCGLLYWGKVVAIPVALALLFSFMLNPLVRRLHRARLPRPVAVAITVGLACCAITALAWVIGTQLAGLSDDLPKYQENIALKIKDMRGMMSGGAVENIKDTMKTLAHELDKEPPTEGKPQTPSAADGPKREPVPVYLTTPQKLFHFDGLSALLPILDPLTTAGLVLVLVVLMLLRWDDMRSRLISFSGHKNLTVATKAFDDAGRRITRYLLMQFIVNASYGLIIASGLYFLDVRYAALWGLCGAIFRYVPYAGPLVSALLPIGFSFITSEGWSQPLWVAGLIICLELIINNLIEPWLYGSNLGLSAMGIIVAAVAWTFLWGPVGLVLATPLTVCLVVMGEYVPAFSIFSRLLGDKPVMEPHFQFYQRLLARDDLEATELARKFVREHGLLAGIEQLFVPALALAKRDDTARLLDPEDIEHVNQSAARLFEIFRGEAAAAELLEKGLEVAETATPRRASLLVWPVNEFASTVATILQWMLRDSSAALEILPPLSLAGVVTQRIRAEQPAAICLLNLSGSDVTRTRQYARRLRTDVPGLPLIVARLGVAGTLSPEILTSFRDAGATAVTRTLNETCAALVPFANEAAHQSPG